MQKIKLKNEKLYIVLMILQYIVGGVALKNIIKGLFGGVLLFRYSESPLAALALQQHPVTTIISLAIAVYIFVLFWNICKDLNTVCEKYEDPSGTQRTPNYLVVCIFTMITFGIYYFYWMNKHGNRMYGIDQAEYKKGVKDTGSTYLLFLFLGLVTFGICRLIANVKFIKNLNLLSEAYNERVGDMESGAHAIAEDDSVTVAMQMPEQTGAYQNRGGCLEGCAGVYDGAQIPIESQSELVIGRDEICSNVVIKNPKVSRKHCSIRYNDVNGMYIVTDHSTNGVYYKNGEALPKDTPVECRPGTILVIAKSGNEFLLR